MSGLTDLPMMVNGSTIKSMVMVLTNGMMAANISGTGGKTICTATESTFTLTEFDTMGSMKMIKKKVTGSTTGRMAVNTRGGGTMGNSMDWEHILIRTKRASSLGCGRTARESNGLMRRAFL